MAPRTHTHTHTLHWYQLCDQSLFPSPVQVKNLRSTVARGAIACLGDLFALMGRAMEQVSGTLSQADRVASTYMYM